MKILAGKKVVEIPQSGVVARTRMEMSDRRMFAGLSIIRTVYGEIYGLPDEMTNTVFIASRPVLEALNNSRDDVTGVGKRLPIESDFIVGNLIE